MLKQTVTAMIAAAATVGVMSAQAKKPAGTNAVTYDVTIKADAAYTGTMDIAIAKGVATGNMLITSPQEITGKVAGTSKAGELALDFPYTMVQRNCTGQIQMNIKMPAKPGPATGTISVVGCGRDATNKLTGTIDLKPAAAAKK
jgi:hypothetical protein